MSAPYKVFAAWQEVRELEFDSLDEANEWAEKLLADEPFASISVSSDTFNGGWFTPKRIDAPAPRAPLTKAARV